MENKIGFYCAALAVFVCVSATAGAETIILKSGQKVTGTILERTDNVLKIDYHGTPVTYYAEEIENIIADPAPKKDKAPARKKSPAETKKLPSQILEESSGAIVAITTQAEGAGKRGTGCVVDARGVVLTSYQLLDGATNIQITLKDGQVFGVEHIIAFDITQDICALKISAVGLTLTPATLGATDMLGPQQRVFVISNPASPYFTLADGAITRIDEKAGLTWIRHSAPVAPGYNGGPVFDTSGMVVGVSTEVQRTKQAEQGTNTAIAIDSVKSLLVEDERISADEFLKPNIVQARHFFVRGQNAFYEQKYRRAINYFIKALTDPEHTKAYAFIGQSFQHLGDFEKSIQYLIKAAEYFPEDSAVFDALGIAYSKTGEFQKAVQAFEREIEIENEAEKPDGKRMSRVHISLGYMYLFLGAHEKAIEHAQEAVALEPEYATKQSYIILGSVYNAQGVTHKAYDYVKKLRIMGEEASADELEAEITKKK